MIRAHKILSMLVLTGFLVVPGPDAGAQETEEEKRRELHYYLKGRYLFQKQCTTCHGTTGRGDGPWAEGLTHKPRNFRSGIYKFRTTPYGALPVDGDLRRTIRSGISGTAMPFFADLTDDEVDALVVYLKTLSREWGDKDLQKEALELPATPSWFVAGEERTSHAEKGGSLFATHCAACHGPGGKGDGPGGQNLVDAWEHPIAPANLAAEHHKSGDSPGDLYRTIATGLNGTPMIGYADVLDEAQIWDLVAFVLELPQAEEKPTDSTETASTARAERADP